MADGRIIRARTGSESDCYQRPFCEAIRCGSDLLVTMEEHALTGGFGSAVLELLNEREVDSSHVLRIGIEDDFVPHGKTDFLKNLAGLDARSIVEKIKARLEEKQR